MIEIVFKRIIFGSHLYNLFMMIKNTLPQFRDTTSNSMLRTDNRLEFQFSSSTADTVKKISNTEIAQENIAAPKPLKIRNQKKAIITDSSYIKVLDYKKSLSNKSLTVKHNSDIVFYQSTNTTVFQPQNSDTVSATNNNTFQQIITSSDTWNKFIAKDYVRQSNDWMVGVLLFVLILVGWIRMNFKKFFTDNQKAVLSLRDSKRLFEEQNSMSQRIFLGLNVVFFINITLFISQILEYYQILIFNFSLFVTLLFAVLFLILLKVIAFRFIGSLFQLNSLANEAIHHGFVLNRLVGLVLIPFVIAIPFVSDEYVLILIYTGFASFAFLYIIQVLRSLQLFLMKVPSILYSILYICALEIAPVIIIIKFCSLNF